MLKLDEKVVAWTFAIFTFLVFDITGFVWHSLLGQPSVLNLIYPGFWQNMQMLLVGLVGSLISAYLIGILFAKIYNWVSANKRKLI